MHIKLKTAKIIILIALLVFSNIEISAFSISPDTAAKNPNSEKLANPVSKEGEVLVKFEETTSSHKQHLAKKEAGAEQVVEKIKQEDDEQDIQVLKLKKNVSVNSAINSLKRKDEVEFVEPNYVYKTTATPNDPSFSSQWGLHNTGQTIGGVVGTADADVDGTEAWDVETGTSNTIIAAVIDSGIDTTHPDLSSKLWVNTDEVAGNGVDDDGNGYIDDVNGYNFAGISLYSANAAYSFGSSGTDQAFAQSIKGTGQNLSHVGIGLQKINSPSQNITVSIRSSLEGADLASATITPAEVGTSATEEYVALSSTVSLTNGSTYYIVAQTSNNNASNFYYIYANIYGYSDYENDPYKDGTIWTYNGSWSADTDNDLYFTTNANGFPRDDNGHGTHVGGIIGAAANNGVGIAGVSYGAKIMALKAGDSSGSLSSADIIAAINYAVNNGARIINMSFGGTGYSSLTQTTLTNAYNAGVALFASSGNSYDTTMQYPAGYSNVIGVGATNNQDAKASFSTYNASVDISAPGRNIYSTMPTYSVGMNSDGYSQNYDFVSGTSMACPMAAGVGAVILAKYPAYTPSQLEQSLTSYSDDLGTAGRDDSFGYGRVNLYNSLTGTVNNPGTSNPSDTTAPSAPSISSTTHSSNSTYYSNANPVFSWSATDNSGVGGYSFLLDSSTTTTPDTISEGTSTSVSFTGVDSGSYYFHIRAVDNSGNWGSTSHYQVLIDSYKPRTYAKGATATRLSKKEAQKYFDNYKTYLLLSKKTKKKKLKKRYKKLASNYLSLYKQAKKGLAKTNLKWRVLDPYTGEKATVILKIQMKKFSKKRALKKENYKKQYIYYKFLYRTTKNKRNKKRYKKLYLKYYKAYKNTDPNYNKTVKNVTINDASIGSWRSATFSTNKAGNYKFLVYAKDQAGNNQFNIASANVRIK